MAERLLVFRMPFKPRLSSSRRKEIPMTPEERQLLNALAERVKNVPPQSKDPEAEQFINNLVRERPDTTYILAQTVIMQDFALRSAQSQIEDLQRQLNEQKPQPQASSGSFLGGLFGGSQAQAPSGSVPRVNPSSRPMTPPPGDQNYGYGGPQGYPPPQGVPPMQPSQTGDFLRSAASTAAGVAGGALLFQGISSLFSGHHGSLLGGLGGDVAGKPPTDSLTETAGVQSHGSDPAQATYYDDTPSERDNSYDADYGGDADPDFGGGDDYA